MNEFLFLVIILVCIVGLYAFFRHFEENGLYLWIVIATLFSFIASFRTMPLYGYNVNASFPIMISIYLCIYILIEKCNKKNIYKVINISVFTSFIFVIYLFLVYKYNPSIYDSVSVYINRFYDNNFLNLVVFPIFLGISEYLVFVIYKFIKEYYDNTFVKNCLTIIVVGIVDTFIYLFIIYIGNKSVGNFLNIILATYSFRLMCSIIYLPFMYYIEKAKKVKK